MVNSVDIHIQDEPQSLRYALGKKGNKMLAVIGANPSTATPEKPDPTVRSIMRIVQHNGYDGWILLNLYPLRVTKPINLPKRCKRIIFDQNIAIIHDQLSTHPVQGVWLAYGNLGAYRPYFKRAITSIHKILHASKLPMLQAGRLTAKGYPRHPLFLPSNTLLEKF